MLICFNNNVNSSKLYYDYLVLSHILKLGQVSYHFWVGFDVKDIKGYKFVWVEGEINLEYLNMYQSCTKCDR